MHPRYVEQSSPKVCGTICLTTSRTVWPTDFSKKSVDLFFWTRNCKGTYVPENISCSYSFVAYRLWLQGLSFMDDWVAYALCDIDLLFVHEMLLKHCVYFQGFTGVFSWQRKLFPLCDYDRTYELKTMGAGILLWSWELGTGSDTAWNDYDLNS